MSLLLDSLILLSFISTISAESNVKRYAIPVGGSVSLECHSNFPAMWSQNKDGRTINLASGKLVLPKISKQRYSASVKGKRYTLTLKNAKLQDSSEIQCNNENNFHVQVVPNPVCGKLEEKLLEDTQVDITCTLDLKSDTNQPKLSWKLGDDKVFETIKIKKGIFKYAAKYLDHGKSMKCVVHAEHWDDKIPKPSCSFGKMEILFAPRIECPSQILILTGQSETSILCKIITNPLPSLNTVGWELFGAERQGQF